MYVHAPFTLPILGASMFSRTHSRFVQLTVGVFTYDHLLKWNFYSIRHSSNHIITFVHNEQEQQVLTIYVQKMMQWYNLVVA